jgi:hypothetical protein
MKYKFYTIIACFTLLVSCKTNPKKPEIIPPSISTGILKESLLTTKDSLEHAGDMNSKISYQIDKAMSLAEQIDFILSKIEEEQSKNDFKNYKPLEKL